MDCRSAGTVGVHDRRKPGDCRVRKQLAERHVHLERILEAGHQLHGQQGVPPEYKKVIVAAHLGHAQELLPDLSEGDFDGPLRCLIGSCDYRSQIRRR